MQVAALELPVAGDALVDDARVKRRDNLHRAGPVLGRDGPRERRLVHVGHADEAAACERRLATPAVAEAKPAHHRRVAEVHLVPVAQKLDVLQVDRLVAADAELEHEPVGKVDQVLVEHRAAAHDGRLPVVAAMCVGARIVDVVHVGPLGAATRAEIAVAGRGQHLPQPLLLGLEGVVGERPILRIGLGSPAGRRWLPLCGVQGGEPVEELLHLPNRVQHVVRGSGAASGLRVVGTPHEDADAAPCQGSEGVLVSDVVAQIDGDHVVSI